MKNICIENIGASTSEIDYELEEPPEEDYLKEQFYEGFSIQKLRNLIESIDEKEQKSERDI